MIIFGKLGHIWRNPMKESIKQAAKFRDGHGRGGKNWSSMGVIPEEKNIKCVRMGF